MALCGTVLKKKFRYAFKLKIKFDEQSSIGHSYIIWKPAE